MKWQSVSEKLKAYGAYIFKKRSRSRTLWIGGSGSVIGFLMLFVLLTGVSIESSGDQVCGEECISYINITTTYWRICFEDTFEPSFTDKDIRTELYVPTYGKKWRLWDASRDCIERKKVNRFKLIGFKDPKETVKWGLALETIFKDYLDPVWYGRSASLNNYGSALSPANNSIFDSTRSIDFIFNATASGIHNKSRLTDNTILNMWFERNSTDMSGSGNDGTIVGGVTNTSGIIGHAYGFDGKGDYVEVTTGVFQSMADNFTIVTWIKPIASDTTNFQRIYDGISSTNIYWDDTNDNIVFQILGSPQVPSTADSVPINEWAHIAIPIWRVNGSISNFTYIINGEVDKSRKTTINISVGTANLRIGQHKTIDRPFNGTIDEFMIFNRTLSSGEISAIYNESLEGEPRLINNCSLLLNIDDENYNTNFTIGQDHNNSRDGDYVVGSWFFEQNSTDNTALSNDGSILGGVTNTSDGMINNAYLFDGKDGWINLGDVDEAEGLSEMSISLWIKTSDQKTARPIDKSNEAWAIQEVNTAGGVRWLFDKAGVGLQVGTESTSISDGSWHFVTAVNDGTDLLMYIDGALDKTDGGMGGIGDTSINNLVIGSSSGIGEFFNGTIDEVQIWNRTLSSGEISSIYNLTKIRQEGTNNTINVKFDNTENDIDWKIQCYDDLHQPWNTSEMRVAVDTSGPSVQFNFPKNDSWLGSKYTNFTFNVTDQWNISNCSLWIMNNRTYELNKTNFKITNNANNTINITIDQGLITAKVSCYDSAGHQANTTDWYIWNWSLGLTRGDWLTFNASEHTNLSVPADLQDSSYGIINITFLSGSDFQMYASVNETLQPGINITISPTSTASDGFNLSTTETYLYNLGNYTIVKHAWMWMHLLNATEGAFYPGIDFISRLI